jgi:hypothetical protein
MWSCPGYNVSNSNNLETPEDVCLGDKAALYEEPIIDFSLEFPRIRSPKDSPSQDVSVYAAGLHAILSLELGLREAILRRKV